MLKKLIRITTVPMSLEKLLENQLRFMKQYYNVTAISSDKVNLERVAKLQEASTFHVEMTRKITPFKDLKAVWQLYSYFKKEKPLMVHTHTPKAGTLGMLAAKLAGVPHRLHTIAGLPLLEATGSKRKLLNAVEKATYACATHIYPNSFGLKEIIIQEQFCKPAKLKVLGNGSSNGIDTAYFNPENFSAQQNQELKNSLGIHPNDFAFIFVGRLVGDKGINELVAAFKKVQRQKSKVKSLNKGDIKFSNNEQNSSTGLQNRQLTTHNPKLLLVGPLETDLDPLHKNTLLEIDENPNIISVGYQKDVRPYLAISNCLSFPSYREGFPNVVMQAGAMGLPSIVTNINGCNEIIIEGQNGTIIPVKDTNALYNAMKKMIADDNYDKQLQQNARPMIVSRYEQHLVWEAILAEYKRLEKNV
ncbi:glycosyltransferase family 4 protein [Nonlabens sp.]|uniref:glycosyltransferase family 4 protein n=1 Tax=Nonlabens sp. TaxID=1888209 RepID=UPI001BCC2753|nr:glycosyltransferase family 4 protein [Nonlabens sp.]